MDDAKIEADDRKSGDKIKKKKQQHQKSLLFSVDRILSSRKDEGKAISPGDINAIEEDERPVKRLRIEVPTQTPTSSISSPSSAGSTSPPDNNNRNDDDDDDDDEREREKQKKAKKKEEPICSKGYIVQNGVTVELVSQELWKKFHKLGTEMIITKAGRRMFPTLKVRISGLDPNKTFAVLLELSPYDDKRYRYVYHSSQWMVAGAGDPPPEGNLFLHGESPAKGAAWNSQGVVAFDKLKLTNNRALAAPAHGQVCLHSMHKYVPRIFIQEIRQDQKNNRVMLDRTAASEFVFPETVFTTVTAYQNQQITKLKIASNPFAKGFREATRTRDPHPADVAAANYINFSKSLEAAAAAAFALREPHIHHPMLPPPLGPFFPGALVPAAAAFGDPAALFQPPFSPPPHFALFHQPQPQPPQPQPPQIAAYDNRTSSSSPPVQVDGGEHRKCRDDVDVDES